MEATPANSHPAAEPDLQSVIAPRLLEARENLVAFNERAMSFVRARPATCVFGAIALGFVVGKIAARY